MLYALAMMSRQEKKEILQATAARIKALRKAAGMTQEQLSERADIATQCVSRLENGHQVPSLLTIVALANALNTTPSVLLGDAVTYEQEDRLRKIGAMLGTLNEDDAEFLESELERWMSQLRKDRR
jgi:transcriptional regulator with XRE-family HTH domain